MKQYRVTVELMGEKRTFKVQANSHEEAKQKINKRIVLTTKEIDNDFGEAKSILDQLFNITKKP